MMKQQKGITLIALVITIIVLLILAGVSIAMLTGDNGILTRAREAETSTTKGEVADKINMTINASFAEILAYGRLSETGTDVDEISAAIAAENGISETDFVITPVTDVTTNGDVLTIKPKANGKYGEYASDTNLEGKITYDSTNKKYTVNKAEVK